MSIKKQQLLDLLLSIEKKEDLDDILYILLTPKEYEEVANRVEILKKLKAGETQRGISDELDVSVATVTRGSREIQNKPDQVQKLFDILEKIND